MNSFFSKDCFTLKRSPSIRVRKPQKLPTSSSKRIRPSTSVKSRPLQAIPELSEDDPDASCDSPCLPLSPPSCTRSLYPSSRHPTQNTNTSCTRGLRSSSSTASLVDFEIERKGEERLSAYEFSIDDTLLMSPRPAPSPPRTPTSPTYLNALLSSSPDSFRLTFSNISLNFPHPPLPCASFTTTVATPSSTPANGRSDSPMSSTSSEHSSSPSSHNSDLPTTPTSEDDDDQFFLLPPSAKCRPRRASIKPLVISKISGLKEGGRRIGEVFTNEESTGAFTTLPSEEKEIGHETNLSLPSWVDSDADSSDHSPKRQQNTDSDSDSESDAESDYEAANEWYIQQFKDILTLCTPPPTATAPARPDSMFSLPLPSPTLPRTTKRLSKPLPDIPVAEVTLTPSPTLDPTFPRRKRAIIPARPPPPLPSSLSAPSSSAPPSSAPASTTQMSLDLTLRRRTRPPPRMSVPADIAFDFTLDLEANEEEELEEGYDFASLSSASVYSQEEEEEEEFAPIQNQETPETVTIIPSFFDIDVQLSHEDDDNTPPLTSFPLSLPTSPIDLEAEFVEGLEQLKRVGVILDSGLTSSSSSAPAPAPVSAASTSGSTSSRKPPQLPPMPPIPATPNQMEPALPETPAAWMYPRTPGPRSNTKVNMGGGELQGQQQMDMERMLKSRWSSSTLSSLRERERERKERESASSRLKLYFGVGGSGSVSSRKGRRGSFAVATSPRASHGSTSGRVMKSKKKLSVSPAAIGGPGAGTIVKSPASPMSFPMSPSPSYLAFSPSSSPSTSPLHSPSRSPSNTPSPSRKEFRRRRGMTTITGAAGDPRISLFTGSPGGHGLRRSASSSHSSAGNSDCGSCCGSSCSAEGVGAGISGGLRRKPIPVEMFIKC